jgi:hypothetical protein
MARVTIKTRDAGLLEFFVLDAGGYVRIESGSAHGILGRQICGGGGFIGNTLRASPESLKAVAYSWLRQCRRLAARNECALIELLSATI